MRCFPRASGETAMRRNENDAALLPQAQRRLALLLLMITVQSLMRRNCATADS